MAEFWGFGALIARNKRIPQEWLTSTGGNYDREYGLKSYDINVWIYCFA